jgi:hypothetical protein
MDVRRGVKPACCGQTGGCLVRRSDRQTLERRGLRGPAGDRLRPGGQRQRRRRRRRQSPVPRASWAGRCHRAHPRWTGFAAVHAASAHGSGRVGQSALARGRNPQGLRRSSADSNQVQVKGITRFENQGATPLQRAVHRGDAVDARRQGQIGQGAGVSDVAQRLPLQVVDPQAQRCRRGAAAGSGVVQDSLSKPLDDRRQGFTVRRVTGPLVSTEAGWPDLCDLPRSGRGSAGQGRTGRLERRSSRQAGLVNLRDLGRPRRFGTEPGSNHPDRRAAPRPAPIVEPRRGRSLQCLDLAAIRGQARLQLRAAAVAGRLVMPCARPSGGTSRCRRAAGMLPAIPGPAVRRCRR